MYHLLSLNFDYWDFMQEIENRQNLEVHLMDFSFAVLNFI